MKSAIKVKRGACVMHGHFGPLYITGHFRDGSGTVWMGVNGVDGVSYQFNASEVKQLLGREDFDAEVAVRKAAGTLKPREGN